MLWTIEHTSKCVCEGSLTPMSLLQHSVSNLVSKAAPSLIPFPVFLPPSPLSQLFLFPISQYFSLPSFQTYFDHLRCPYLSSFFAVVNVANGFWWMRRAFWHLWNFKVDEYCFWKLTSIFLGMDLSTLSIIMTHWKTSIIWIFGTNHFQAYMQKKKFSPAWKDLSHS